MSGRREFWVLLHQLATAYAQEGASPNARMNSLITQFQSMPAIAQRELLADLSLLSANLFDINTTAALVVTNREALDNLARESVSGEAELGRSPAQATVQRAG